MIQDTKNEKHYIAEKGYTFKRKIDDFIMGDNIYLGLFIDGTKDTIENYEEIIDENYVEKKIKRPHILNKNVKIENKNEQ